MATATGNRIELMDKVRVSPTEDSAFEVKQFFGRQGTVYARTGDDLLVVFEHGVRLCLSPSEVQKVSGLAERLMEISKW